MKVRVQVTGKGNYTEGTAEGSYYIMLPPAGSADLSKAKIAVKDDEKMSPLPNQSYTGKAVRPAIDVYVKQDGSWTKVDDKTYSVGYLNNKNKGKATLIVTGDGKASYGSKTQKFTIGAANLKDLDPLDIMRALGLKAKE